MCVEGISCPYPVMSDCMIISRYGMLVLGGEIVPNYWLKDTDDSYRLKDTDDSYRLKDTDDSYWLKDTDGSGWE